MGIFLMALLMVVGMALSAYSRELDEVPSGQIYLYGEAHSIKKILDKEFELWYEYYHSQNMRHLFVEYPYYTAEFLNLWMKSDNDTILEEVYNDWEGTLAHSVDTKEFLKKIKSECPETIFHGTDVGHQYSTTGERFLKYLEKNNLKKSKQYSLTLEAIEQGKNYYAKEDHSYRENKMVENFIHEFETLNGENIMGIYGAAHVGDEAMDIAGTMGNQLRDYYTIFSEDLSWIVRDIDPYRTDQISVDGKNYTAYYFGDQDLTWHKDYLSREFWRLENAYDDFKNKQKTGDVLPYNNYPMLIEKGQVFIIDYKKTDGSVERQYYRSDGSVWEGRPVTEEFMLK